MVRIPVGMLPGGVGPTPDPETPFRLEVLRHPRGRLQAERQKVINLACLKSWGMLGNYPTLTASGALYQDFMGTKQYVRCHRSVFEPIVNGRPLADVPGVVGARTAFRKLLIIPGALTDPEPPPANYGDRLFEIVTHWPILKMLRSVLSRQPTNSPLETNMIEDVIAGELPSLMSKGYDDAIFKAGDIQKKRGWDGVSLTSEEPFKEAARISLARRGPNSRSAKVIKELKLDLRLTGPQSEIVDQRIDNMFDTFHENGEGEEDSAFYKPYTTGPSRYGPDLTRVYLQACQHATKGANMVNIGEACDQLAAATEHRSNEKVSNQIDVAPKGEASPPSIS